MPFALVLIGLLLIITGAQDTYIQFGRQLQKDFTGPGNFTYWIAAIVAVGALGYSETLRPISRAFLVLVIVAIMLANPGVASKFMEALKSGPVKPQAVAGPEHVIEKDVDAKKSYDKAQENFGTTLKWGTRLLELFTGTPAF